MDHFFSHGRGADEAGGQASSSGSKAGQTDAPQCRCSSAGSWSPCSGECSSSSRADLSHSASAKINEGDLGLQGDECAASTPRFRWATVLFKLNKIILIITWISISIGCLRVGIYLDAGEHFCGQELIHTFPCIRDVNFPLAGEGARRFPVGHWYLLPPCQAAGAGAMRLNPSSSNKQTDIPKSSSKN